MTVQLHRLLNSLHKGNTSKKLEIIKEKHLLWENVECSHTLKHANSLEHWITFTYIINSEMVETEAEVCTIHHIGCCELPAFFIKILL